MDNNSNKEIEIDQEKQLQKARSSRRFFILFITIDVLLAAVVIYEIVQIVIEFVKTTA
jgi:hypothetical protein